MFFSQSRPESFYNNKNLNNLSLSLLAIETVETESIIFFRKELFMKKTSMEHKIYMASALLFLKMKTS